MFDDRFEKIQAMPGDVVLVHAEIGQMPPSRVHPYLLSAKNALKHAKIFPETVKTFFAAMRNGKPGISVEVISPKIGDLVKFNVEVGNIPPSKAKEYMEKVKENMLKPMRIFPEGVNIMFVPMRDGVPTVDVVI